MSNRKQKEISTEIERLLSKYKEKDGKIRDDNGNVLSAMCLISDQDNAIGVFEGNLRGFSRIVESILSHIKQLEPNRGLLIAANACNALSKLLIELHAENYNSKKEQ